MVSKLLLVISLMCGKAGNSGMEMKRMNLQEILLEACRTDQMSKEENKRIQCELFDLMTQIVISHSENPMELQAEKIEQLLESISYTIELSIFSGKELEDQILLLKTIPISQHYKNGQKQLQRLMKECRQMSEKLISCHLQLNNQAYTDTIAKGIPEFLENYDLEQKAQELPGFFDYPLCVEIKNKKGILYAQKYLEELLWEEEFLHLFEEERVLRLAEGYVEDYSQLSINFFELVFANVIGNLLIGVSASEMEQLSMNSSKYKHLEELLDGMGHLEMSDCMNRAMHQLFVYTPTQLSSGCKKYLQRALERLGYRCQQNVKNQTLDKFFVMPNNAKNRQDSLYQSSTRLSSTQLERIIEELKECRYTTDKLALVRKQLSNLEDLVKVLSECIYGEEARELFLVMNDQELAALMVIVLNQSEMQDCYNYDGSQSWHIELLMMIQQLPLERQAKINQFVSKYNQNNG